MNNSRIQLPPSARPGETVQVQLLIEHPMESGFRRDDVGRAIPKNVIHTLSCRYGGAEVFRAELGSGIAANPYLAFHVVARASGELTFEWRDDSGQAGSARAMLNVSA